MKVRSAYGEFRIEQLRGSVTVNHLRLRDGQQEPCGITILITQMIDPTQEIAAVFVDLSILEAESLARRILQTCGVY